MSGVQYWYYIRLKVYFYLFMVVCLQLCEAQKAKNGITHENARTSLQNTSIVCQQNTQLALTTSPLKVTSSDSTACNISVTAPPNMGIQLVIMQSYNWSTYHYFYIKTDLPEVCWDKEFVVFTRQPEICSTLFSSSNLEINIKASTLLQLSVFNITKSHNIFIESSCNIEKHTPIPSKVSGSCKNLNTFDTIFRSPMKTISSDFLLEYNQALGEAHSIYNQIEIFQNGSMSELAFPYYVVITEFPLTPSTCTSKISLQTFEMICPEQKPSYEILLIYEPSSWSSLSTVLDASRRNVVKIAPGSFEFISDIAYLLLNENKMASLHDGTFTGLYRLQVLNLSNNQLSHVPDGIFSDLGSLQQLYLNGNLLSELTSEIFSNLAQLKILFLNDNVLSLIAPEAFVSLQSLEILSIAENMLHDIHKPIFKHVRNTLFYLNISYNHFTTLQPGIFNDLNSLTALRLYRNQLTTLNETIFHGLDQMLTLLLWGNNLTNLNAYIFHSLVSLSILDLSVNQLIKLDVNLFHGLHKLSYLSLHTNQLTTLQPGIFDDLNSLTELWLYQNQLTTLNETIFNGFDQMLIKLALWGNHLTNLNSNIFHSLVSLSILDLSVNQLITLDVNLFHGLHKLSYLSLHTNQLTTLQPGIFDDLNSLTELWLYQNQFKKLDAQVFKQLQKLEILVLHNNQLKSLKSRTFSECKHLSVLVLNDNKIPIITADVFSELYELKRLELANNTIQVIKPNAFQALVNLTTLWLYNNLLTYVDANIFTDLNKLELIFLDGNRLSQLESFVFQHLSSIRLIDCSKNTLHVIHDGAFSGLQHLEFINLTVNPLSHLDTYAFNGLRNHVTILVDSQSVCKCYVSHHNGPRCISSEDPSPYLSCEQLLINQWVKVSVWIIAIGTIIGNGSIILWRSYVMCLSFKNDKRHKPKRDMKQQFLIVNLAIADLLMGVYLLIIAGVDLHYHQYFPLHAEKWRKGSLCKVAGILSVLSSQASLFFLTVISAERFWTFKSVRGNMFSTRLSRIIPVVPVWVLAITLSILPLYVEGVDYEFSEVCIGLPLARSGIFYKKFQTISRNLTDTERIPNNFTRLNLEKIGSKLAPYYSIGLYLGLDLFCCITLALCYISIFHMLKYRFNQMRMSTSRLQMERMMAIKMGLLVVTDFMCWMPIIILGILVQAEYIVISPTSFAWIIAFVLPINSVLNPFLYAFGQKISSYFDRKQQFNRQQALIQETAL